MSLTAYTLTPPPLRCRLSAMSDPSHDFESFTLISQDTEGGGNGAGLLGGIKAGKEWIQDKRSGVRPWGEFFALRRVTRPSGAGDVTKRLIYNLQRYQNNYLFVFLGLFAYCM